MAKSKYRNLVGQHFGRLIVKHRVTSHRDVVWECLCDCGNTSHPCSHNLISGGAQCLIEASS